MFYFFCIFICIYTYIFIIWFSFLLLLCVYDMFIKYNNVFRFDKHVDVPMPDIAGRKAILELHAKKVRVCVNK